MAQPCVSCLATLVGILGCGRHSRHLLVALLSLSLRSVSGVSSPSSLRSSGPYFVASLLALECPCGGLLGCPPTPPLRRFALSRTPPVHAPCRSRSQDATGGRWASQRAAGHPTSHRVAVARDRALDASRMRSAMPTREASLSVSGRSRHRWARALASDGCRLLGRCPIPAAQRR